MRIVLIVLAAWLVASVFLTVIIGGSFKERESRERHDNETDTDD